jgi:parallel beta-helix repeat protein
LVTAAPGAAIEATSSGPPRSAAQTGTGAKRRIAGASHRQRALAGALAIALATAAAVALALALGGGDNAGKTPARVATLRVPGQFPTLQAALNAAKAGDTIAVAAGSFSQQLTIRKRVTLTGAGTNATTIRAPSSLAPGPLASLRSIITVVDGAHATISHLKITGSPTVSCASPADLDTGILVGQNATLDLRSAAVTNIRDIPARCVRSQTRVSAVTIGVSSTAYTSSRSPKTGAPAGGYASPGHATIKADLISGYENEGVDVAGSGSTATIIDSHISGVGSSSARVVDGINVHLGGAATIIGNTITGNQCTSLHAAASLRRGKPCGPGPLHQAHDMGILVGLTGPGTLISDNKVSGNDVGIQLVKAPACCTVSHNTLAGNRYFGDVIWDAGSGSVNADTISGSRVGVGVVAQGNNTAVALHNVSIKQTAVAPTRTYSCCGHHATVVH